MLRLLYLMIFHVIFYFVRGEACVAVWVESYYYRSNVLYSHILSLSVCTIYIMHVIITNEVQ